MKIFTSNIDIIISLLDNLDALDISLQSQDFHTYDVLDAFPY